MGKYFNLAELTRSTTATNRDIDNTPSPIQKEKLILLINKLLDPIRESWGAPIRVNSGFRCRELNRAVGGVSSSQHTKAEAADITAGSPERNKQLFQMILDMEVEFDQLIDEKNFSWLHISYREGANRNQILKL